MNSEHETDRFRPKARLDLLTEPLSRIWAETDESFDLKQQNEMLREELRQAERLLAEKNRLIEELTRSLEFSQGIGGLLRRLFGSR